MHAIVISQPGGPESLVLTELRDPVPGPGEVLIDVVAAGVNRADVLQRKGLYPPPVGVPEWPGLECSGRIAGVGDGVVGWAIGDAVCALLAGGGYASKVVVPAVQCLPVPTGVDLVSAAGLPETVCTVWSTVILTAGLQTGETLLVHGGASGIGTTAIQIGRAWGARVAVTARTADRLQACADLGADVLIEYPTDDFVARVKDATGGRGADVVLDVVGGQYLGRNLCAMAPGGRLVVIALQGGARGELNLARLLTRRLSIFGSTLRARPVAEKGALVADVHARAWPLVESGQVRPIIDRVLPLADAAQAHRVMEAGDHVGKILLTV